jgi:hypothetical protein
MKKNVLLLLVLILFTGCAQSRPIPQEFNEEIMDDDNKTSLVYSSIVGYGKHQILSFNIPTYYEGEHILKLYRDEPLYELELKLFEDNESACLTKVDFDNDYDSYLSKLEDLKNSYSNILLNLGEPVAEEKNNNVIYIGLKVVDGKNINTAYIYQNKVMEIIIKNKIEYYILSDKQVEEWATLLYDFIAFYEIEENVPCYRKVAIE